MNSDVEIALYVFLAVCIIAWTIHRWMDTRCKRVVMDVTPWLRLMKLPGREQYEDRPFNIPIRHAMAMDKIRETTVPMEPKPWAAWFKAKLCAELCYTSIRAEKRILIEQMEAENEVRIHRPSTK